MVFKLISIFPEMLENILSVSIIGRAVKKGLLEINYVNLRDYTEDKHKKVDDYPFGGGPGMLLKPEPVFRAIMDNKIVDTRVIYMSPKGKPLNQQLVEELSNEKDLMIIAGHYEGLDQRIIDHYIDEVISIGDYVLTGGELPAAILVDAVGRLIPGVLSNEESGMIESHSDILLEHPQYTRPREFNGIEVPDVLLSGNHQRILKWQRFKSLETTINNRPDLINDKSDLINEYFQLKAYFGQDIK
ncbi:MAG: tRNA (Guanine37-N1)-methyltransferase [Clostridiales bacterium 38_11]|nr:MAG: tRNA (Guanine37-N1)-methyltransferase [Clostridiales bacterium 38_11]HBH11527.1 tRNA (guanosine(37)-N1)-methyltransferase TrmD [Clostridiales bacterium]